MQYDTLKQLRDAYRAGEVTVPLVLDNDSADVDDGARLFSMHPDDLLDQALSLLGIPHESV